ncbi:MAG TPA: Holliday junction resolvase RuvX [Candidatus Saccharimonadales bacterium]|nr:Holliday junction resolvase RuvX [Candidatus Saccharimonadales bacterium]
MTATTPSTVLAFDVGERRIGVAVANGVARIAAPLTTLANEGDIAATIAQLVHDQQASALVLGLPRGLDGQETAQTRLIRQFGEHIRGVVGVPLYWQDEAVTSAQAEAELKHRGKPYVKADIDALSATYILEDYLRDNPGEF